MSSQLFTNYFGGTGVIGRTVWFLLYMSAEFKFCVFLPHDTMLAWVCCRHVYVWCGWV